MAIPLAERRQTYILARRDPALTALWKRFQSMCFLATPHRGSDWAQILGKILQVADRSRAYLGDLKRDSLAIQSINQDFKQYSAEIDIKSFYETQKLSVGFLKPLIVDKESATLDYDREQKIPMYADHRSICKYDSTSDPNYRILRDVLSRIVYDVLKQREFRSSRNNPQANFFVEKWLEIEQTRDRFNDLKEFLDINEEWGDDLIASEDSRLPGTCAWVKQKSYYQAFSDFHIPEVQPLLWLKGRPASGKSVLVSYIIGELEKEKCSYSYYFFKHGQASKSRLSTCLRSIAFQMAQKYPQVGDIILEIRDDITRSELNDERTIWRKIFLSGIFRAHFSQHFWIIDAVDECLDSTERLSNILAKIDPSLPLRILITSRESADLETTISAMGPKRCFSTVISPADTLSDIRLLIEKQADSMIAGASISRNALVSEILQKSNGSFLWTVLVLKELSRAHGETETRHILDEVPGEMKALYLRCIENMSRASRGKALAKAILYWVICSMRPLTVGELQEALKLDLNDNFPNLGQSVSALCGQLVFVDRFEKVQMIHETAREFLLEPFLDSEFAVEKVDAHTRIARSCLQYLSSDEMRPPRTRRRDQKASAFAKRGAFASYASEAFSYHLVRANPSSRAIYHDLSKFLQVNVMSWIEAVAQTRSLTAMIRTAKHLGRYADRWAVEHSPLGPQMKALRYWSTDLVRIAAKFGDALISSPSVIYWLIVPFCPVESAIGQMSISGSRLLVVGVSNREWDDRLACIDFQNRQVSALSYSEELLAVALQSGTVALYHASSFQEYKQLDHGEPVKFLQFKPKSDLLGTCGLKHIRLWNFRTSELLYCFPAPRRPLCIAFEKDCLTVASTGNALFSWNLQDGTQRPDRPWYELKNNDKVTPIRSPCAISISVEHQMMAVTYRGQPIILWDLGDDEFYGVCGKKLPNGAIGPYWVVDLVFNPNVAVELLAATYQDGDLVLLDPFNDQTLKRFRANCHTLAASPDGHMLAAANALGEIMIYEFETLRLLYRVKTTTSNIKQLAFSTDGLRFLDCRGSQCNVWEPVALLRNTVNDYGSAPSVSASTVEGSTTPVEKPRITAMTLTVDGNFAFCGKEDGKVALYDLKTGEQLNVLYKHKAQLNIHTLVWWHSHSVLMSIDASNSTYAWNMKPSNPNAWIPHKELFHRGLDCGWSIVQLFVIEGSNKFILSTREADYLWNLRGEQEKCRTCTATPGIRIWVQHPQYSSHIICVEGATARIYTSHTWEEVAVISTGIELRGFQLRRIFSREDSCRMLVEFSDEDGAHSARLVQILDTSIFSLDKVYNAAATSGKADGTEQTGLLSPTALRSPLYSSIACHVSHCIGLFKNSRLAFLDTHSWICSVDLEDLTFGSSYLRHFYIPYDWFSGSKEVICVMTGEGTNQSGDRDILLARNGELAIIRNGFDHLHSFPYTIDEGFSRFSGRRLERRTG